MGGTCIIKSSGAAAATGICRLAALLYAMCRICKHNLRLRAAVLRFRRCNFFLRHGSIISRHVCSSSRRFSSKFFSVSFAMNYSAYLDKEDFCIQRDPCIPVSLYEYAYQFCEANDRRLGASAVLCVSLPWDFAACNQSNPKQIINYTRKYTARTFAKEATKIICKWQPQR